MLNLPLLYTILMFLFVFSFGLVIGSFLNVCIYRIPNSISIIQGRSHCPKCKHQLNFPDLMPLFSYLLQKGKCRYCGSKISSRYFFVELLTGIIFLLIYQRYGYSLNTLIHCIFVSALIVIAYVDYDTMDIYDYNHYLIIALGILRHVLISDLTLIEQLLGGIILFLPLLLIYYFIKDGLGGGDVKLVGSCGFYLGITNIIYAFFISTLCATLYALYLLLIKKKSPKTQIPFGPFLCFGFIFTIL